jgi:DNA-binding FrmR family transcriptional regulator
VRFHAGASRFFGTLKQLHFTHRNPMSTAKASPATHPAASAGAKSGATSAYRTEHQRDVVNRLKRIEGQVRGLIDMVESGRPCEDVAQQMSAARKAMEKTFYRMMACTVMEAVTSSESEVETFREVERSTRILEKYA